MLGLSALTWFVIIVAGYALLLLILPREYMWIPFVAVVVAMTVLAYHIVPDETDDLYRYYGMLDIMREQGKAGLDYIVERNWYDWQTFVTMRYYFYFLSFFPNNRYLAAVTMFIVYALMFLVMYKAAQRYQVSKGYVLMGTLFFLSTYWFYDTASGIRNGLAFNQFEVFNDELGKPRLRLWGEALKLAEKLGVAHMHVTIADERHYASATVIIES